MTTTWQNWGRSALAHPVELAAPHGVDELAAVLRSAGARGLTVRPVGAGHSFTPIVATDGVLLDLSAFSGLLSVDGPRRRVRLGAGTRLHELPTLLEPHGLALENLGDIDRQTVAGAISTGTHGTGARFRGLAAQVVGATLVTAAGAVLEVDEESNADLLPAVSLGLGALGVLVDVTIQCVPAFLLRAHEGSAALDDVLSRFDEFATADHFECYWFPGTSRVQTKSNTRLPLELPHRPPRRASRTLDQLVVQNGLLRAVCEVGVAAPGLTPGLNSLATKVLGEKVYTDRSHAVFTSPRHVRFRESEYAVPREVLPDAVRALRGLVERRGWRISFPVEIRTAAADDLWLSTAHGRDSGYIAVHRYWKEDPRQYFREFDALMREFDGRPHWGKIHDQDAASLAGVYPRFEDFLAVRNRLDPDRLFANDYLRKTLGE